MACMLAMHRLYLGNARWCTGESERCERAVEGNGQARLVGGGADAGGAWEYGILEVLLSGFYSDLENGINRFGRRGAQVACRSLGFATGAQLLAGQSSPLPTPATSLTLISDITCDGSETSLADCNFRTLTSEPNIDYGFDVDVNIQSVALLCTTPSGALLTVSLMAAMLQTFYGCFALNVVMKCCVPTPRWSLCPRLLDRGGTVAGLLLTRANPVSTFSLNVERTGVGTVIITLCEALAHSGH